MKVVVTGADGFLGWHTRVRLAALTDHTVVPVGRAQWSGLPTLLADADAVIHIAGVNRADDPDAVRDGNISLAEDLAIAIRSSARLSRVVFANTTQMGNGSPYAAGKGHATAILRDAAAGVDAAYVDVWLPNLFGEHGRPNYNSFVATFVDKAIRGETPDIADRVLELLHVQEAADVLIEGLDTFPRVIVMVGTDTTVHSVWDRLSRFYEVYRTGEIPHLDSAQDVHLFNTLRAAMFPAAYPMPLQLRTDPRGSLVETVRCHGGPGQTFVSTTRAGVTRGEHYHLDKVERFCVIGGQARISLRRMLTDEVVSFDVNGDTPVVIDMPTLWAHNITNTGSELLTTLFWTNSLFDPDAPDTYPEPVHRATTGVA